MQTMHACVLRGIVPICIHKHTPRCPFPNEENFMFGILDWCVANSNIISINRKSLFQTVANITGGFGMPGHVSNYVAFSLTSPLYRRPALRFVFGY